MRHSDNRHNTGAALALRGHTGQHIVHVRVAVVGVAHMDGIERKWVERFGPGSARSIPAP